MDIGIWPWILFNAFLITMLALDLFVFHRHAHVIKLKEAVGWVGLWISLAVIFGLGLWVFAGSHHALNYFSAYVVEEALSVDNLFVFLMLFTYFCVPREYRHRVLFWGIIGAILMRAAFIFGGIALINSFHWIIYVFGAFLVFTGIKMGMKKEEDPHPEANPVLKLLRRFLPMSHQYDGGKFFTVENGRRLATPLLAVLVAVETTDIIFAVDSIPAVLSITTDPFIVYTSNMFAIMGLRSIYFALEGFADRLYYLHYGLATILVFLGFKMLISGIYHMPTLLSLLVIAIVLGISVIASLKRPPQPELPPESPFCETGFMDDFEKDDR
ncbi:MAG: TerC family protein [Dehalogenimonas sp.]|uniref:TerC family protein n=1 Tax=Candidatus Dehalogenimonas loeffleri TaxID=3127115 RepID=A0ABZ2J6C0_9CHLR|nr:TerC family protein [Dehalogenimonas sp.]